MDLEIRPLANSESNAIWSINEEGLPGTGKVSEQRDQFITRFFLICHRCISWKVEISRFCHMSTSKHRVWELNYAWFNQRYE